MVKAARSARRKTVRRHFVKHAHTFGVSDMKIQAEIIGFVILTGILAVFSYFLFVK